MIALYCINKLLNLKLLDCDPIPLKKHLAQKLRIIRNIYVDATEGTAIIAPNITPLPLLEGLHSSSHKVHSV